MSRKGRGRKEPGDGPRRRWTGAGWAGGGQEGSGHRGGQDRPTPGRLHPARPFGEPLELGGPLAFDGPTPGFGVAPSGMRMDKPRPGHVLEGGVDIC